MSITLKMIAGRSVALMAVTVCACLAMAEKSHGQEEGGFTPIPVIKGMQLLADGTPAPTFKVRDINGEEFDFAQHSANKSHLLVFWSIFCEPCREEMPIIEQVHQEYMNRNLAVIAVNMDGEPFLEGIRGYIKQYSYSFAVLLDQLDEETFRIADPYQVAGTPVLYLIDSQGQVFTSHLGRITLKDLKDLIESMLQKG